MDLDTAAHGPTTSSITNANNAAQPATRQGKEEDRLPPGFIHPLAGLIRFRQQHPDIEIVPAPQILTSSNL